MKLPDFQLTIYIFIFVYFNLLITNVINGLMMYLLNSFWHLWPNQPGWARLAYSSSPCKQCKVLMRQYINIESNYVAAFGLQYEFHNKTISTISYFLEIIWNLMNFYFQLQLSPEKMKYSRQNLPQFFCSDVKNSLLDTINVYSS